ncbi:hypothetical protein BHE74_00007117 [Ensete ventricosum]|nr:hypothetical protein BHE74_00007117 [Ensete ventricosum]
MGQGKANCDVRCFSIAVTMNRDPTRAVVVAVLVPGVRSLEVKSVHPRISPTVTSSSRATASRRQIRRDSQAHHPLHPLSRSSPFRRCRILVDRVPIRDGDEASSSRSSTEGRGERRERRGNGETVVIDYGTRRTSCGYCISTSKSSVAHGTQHLSHPSLPPDP